MTKKICIFLAIVFVLVFSLMLLDKFDVIHIWNTPEPVVTEQTEPQNTETEIEVPVIVEDTKKE